MHRAVLNASPLRLSTSRFCLALALAASAALAACTPSTDGASGDNPAPAPSRPGNQTPDPNPPAMTPPTPAASGGATGSGGAPATGGSTGTTASGGSTGSGGAPATTPDPTPPPASDAAAPATDGGTPTPPSAPAAGPEDPKAFECTLVIGIAATGQWFGAGFEKIVPNEKWELLAVHSGFVQYWADPANAFWSKAPSSACTTNAKTPDRVILEALYLHWMDATVEQWVTVLDQAVKTFKAKNPNLKRLEFSTFIRAPGDKPCPASMPFKSWIRPEQDEAYQKVAAMYPGFVTVAPKFKVASCADYGGNPPHFTGGGASAAAKLVGEHYAGISSTPAAK
jgi:hypothetical protein